MQLSGLAQMSRSNIRHSKVQSKYPQEKFSPNRIAKAIPFRSSRFYIISGDKDHSFKHNIISRLCGDALVLARHEAMNNKKSSINKRKHFGRLRSVYACQREQIKSEKSKCSENRASAPESFKIF